MAAKIRLKKVGRRGQPSYRVVVLDGRKPRDAKVVADLGHYDPKTNPATFEIDGDAALKWLLEGAKATRAARDILSKAGGRSAGDAARRGETVEIEKKERRPTAKKKKTEEAEEAAPEVETAADVPVAEEPEAEAEAAEEEAPEAAAEEAAEEPEAEAEAEAEAEDQEAADEEADEGAEAEDEEKADA